MKFIIPVLCVSCLALTSCDHYSADLAAFDRQFSTAPFSASSAQDLNTVTPAAGAMSAMSFDEALAREYHTLARAEQADMDYRSAKVFTDKATQSMRGETVLPFKAPSEAATQKRAMLIQALQTQKIPENYTALARAQAQYDHWIEQTSEGHQSGDIQNCKDGFEQAMASLISPFAGNKTYAVAFDPGQAVVTPGAADILKDMMMFLESNNIRMYQVRLSGAPVQVGAVIAALMDLQIPAIRISSAEMQGAPDTVRIDVHYKMPDTQQSEI